MQQRGMMMVSIDRVYTRAGDGGTTMIGDGTIVPKTHPRIEAHAAVDELICMLAVVEATAQASTLGVNWRGLQNELFDLGADLSIPLTSPTESIRRITEDQVAAIEKKIDQYSADQPPLASFVLPGGSELSTRLHLARAVCRRAELAVWRLHAVEEINPVIPKYLNRLSDWLFVLSRAANGNGKDDQLWVPALQGGEDVR